MLSNKSSWTASIAVIASGYALRVAPAAEEAVSLTREGKRRLRERFLLLKKTRGLSLERVAAKLGIKHHNMVSLLIHDEETIGESMTPVWSSSLVPRLCRILGVPLWEVVAGIDETQAKLLEHLERVRESAPEAVSGFLDAVALAADGLISRHGRRAEHEEERPPTRPIPPLRPVR